MSLSLICSWMTSLLPYDYRLLTELKMWKTLWSDPSRVTDVPKTLQETMKITDQSMYQNILKLFQILLTIPAQELYPLDNGTTKIHRAYIDAYSLFMDINLETVIDEFSHLHARRMRMSNAIRMIND